MSDYLFLVPISLIMGLVGLLAFMWALRNEQYDDLDGAAERILHAEDRPLSDDCPIAKTSSETAPPTTVSASPIDDSTNGS